MSVQVDTCLMASSDTILPMVSSTVFVSSIMTPEVEDLREERDTVCEVIKSYGFFRAWAFEKTPASHEAAEVAFLAGVDECDILILIIGAKMTSGVRKEIFRTKERYKRILIFSKSELNPSAETQDILKTLPQKRKRFRTLEELKTEARNAIDKTIVDALRDPEGGGQMRAVLDDLHELARRRTQVEIHPMVPPFRLKNFFVEGMDVRSLKLKKASSDQPVNLPLSQIEAILPGDDFTIPKIVINGRLQLRSRDSTWVFLPDKPPQGSRYGSPRITTVSDREAGELAAIIDVRMGRRCCSWRPESLMSSIEYEVVYDDDGYYFKSSPENHVLMWRRDP
jgi:hypothetical protein